MPRITREDYYYVYSERCQRSFYCEIPVPEELVPVRGFFPAYFKELFNRLPAVEKRLVEVDGGVFWMLSNPAKAARIVCDWFSDTIS